MRRVLVIDGGGAKGLIPASALDGVEERLGKPLYEVFDLVVGTSVGGILGAIVASGRLSAEHTLDLMYDVIPKLFSRRMWPLLPKYSRKPFERVWDSEIGAMVMADCRTRYMTTAVSLCDGRTHYFKSWETKDGCIPLKQAVLRTFAAPMYFGGLVDQQERTVWLDGGTGGANCPLLETLYEVVASGWMHDRTHILSIGCGYSDQSVSYDKAKRWWGRNTREVGLYMDPCDGGLARVQAREQAVGLVSRLSEKLPQLTFQRLDALIPSKMDCMDGKEYRDQYVALGRTLAQRIDYSPFVG